jgi:hypothetical protein
MTQYIMKQATGLKSKFRGCHVIDICGWLNCERSKLQILECIFSSRQGRDIDIGLTMLLWITHCNSFESYTADTLSKLLKENVGSYLGVSHYDKGARKKDYFMSDFCIHKI